MAEEGESVSDPEPTQGFTYNNGDHNDVMLFWNHDGSVDDSISAVLTTVEDDIKKDSLRSGKPIWEKLPACAIHDMDVALARDELLGMEEEEGAALEALMSAMSVGEQS